jgi:hypothetical protein
LSRKGPATTSFPFPFHAEDVVEMRLLESLRLGRRFRRPLRTPL